MKVRLLPKSFKKNKQHKNNSNTNNTKNNIGDNNGAALITTKSLMKGVFRNTDLENSTNQDESGATPFPSKAPVVVMEDPTWSDVSDDGYGCTSSFSSNNGSEASIRRPNISVERTIHNAMERQDLASVKANSRLVQSEHLHRLYTDADNLSSLEAGGSLFSFACHHQLTQYESSMVDAMINLSAFSDETTENAVPHFEYADYEAQQQQQQGETTETSNELSEHNSPSSSSSSPTPASAAATYPKYTFLLARCAYVLTGVSLEALLDNPQIIATLDYQNACQPAGTKIWDDNIPQMNGNGNTFRITKPIIPYIYSFTVQFQVSRITDENDLHELSQVFQIPVDGAIVLERTKRSHPPKVDATRKLKSILIYTKIGGEGGDNDDDDSHSDSGVVLVTHLTVMLQVGLPAVVERIIGTIGQWGLGETAETAWRTRRYLQAKLPTSSGNNTDGEFVDALHEVKVQSTDKTVTSKGSLSSDDDSGFFFDAVDDSSVQD